MHTRAASICPGTLRDKVRPSSPWVRYFTTNAAKPSLIPWQLGAEGVERNLDVIAPSLRAWQLGETSDGRHLRAAAQAYADETDDEDLMTAVRLFIGEEQRHGADLGHWLDLAGIPRATSNWGDTCFRAIRYGRPSMEQWATPVVMVETHAMIYYDAIRRATGSPVLRALCARILADEVPHIRFQCERLGAIWQNRAPWLLAVTRLAHRIFFAGVTLAVWSAHGKALQAGGYAFPRFWRTAWRRMGRAWRQAGLIK